MNDEQIEGSARVPTQGEYRVGISFNPGGNPVVSEIKRRAAELIDYISMIEADSTSEHSSAQLNEIARCKAIAMTEVESAAMWAVKAATKPA